MCFLLLLIAPMTFIKILFKFLNHRGNYIWHYCDLDGTGFISPVIQDKGKRKSDRGHVLHLSSAERKQVRSD